MSATPYADLNSLAADFRQQLEAKKFVLLYTYNGTGKTRLSTAFKDLGKKPTTDALTNEAGEPLETEAGETIEVEVMQRDTLSGHAATDHFRGVTKMIKLGSGTFVIGKTGSATP